jgi:hypothetical protein
MKDGRAMEEAFSRQKRTSSTSKHEISRFFLFLGIVFAILDPNPDPAHQNQCESRLFSAFFIRPFSLIVFWEYGYYAVHISMCFTELTKTLSIFFLKNFLAFFVESLFFVLTMHCSSPHLPSLTHFYGKFMQKIL